MSAPARLTAPPQPRRARAPRSTRDAPRTSKAARPPHPWSPCARKPGTAAPACVRRAALARARCAPVCTRHSAARPARARSSNPYRSPRDLDPHARRSSRRVLPVGGLEQRIGIIPPTLLAIGIRTAEQMSEEIRFVSRPLAPGDRQIGIDVHGAFLEIAPCRVCKFDLGRMGNVHPLRLTALGAPCNGGKPGGGKWRLGTSAKLNCCRRISTVG